MLRSWLKHCYYAVLALYAWLRLRLNHKPALIILTYHRVLPENDARRDSEQPGMVISPDKLRSHVQTMTRLGAEFVHLETWLSKSQAGEPLPKLAVAVTFDDGWRDNFQYAYPILQEYQVPFVIFLVSGFVGTDRTFWPEQVMHLLNGSTLPLDQPEFAWLRTCAPDLLSMQRPLTHSEADLVVSTLKQLDDQTIEEHLFALYEAYSNLRPESPDRVILDLEEMKQMQDSGLVRYGAHTRHHYRLNRLKTSDALADEIVGSQRDLNDLSLHAINLFCYPNGDVTDQSEKLVAEHYAGACTTRRGWNLFGCSPLGLRRFSFHDGNGGTSQRFFATLGQDLR